MKKFIYILILAQLILSNTEIFACTMFKVTKNGKTLAGNNEDYFTTYTRVWFEPASEKKFGRVYFGFSDMYPQGGMNDQGLVFDGFATPTLEVENSLDRERYNGSFVEKVMEECATVEEVLNVFNRYSLHWMKKCQLMFVDKTGDSVIIEGDIIQRQKKYYQVVTNFYMSVPNLGGYPCWRYNTAVDMLESSSEISIDLCKSILNRTGSTGSTQYSNIYDLNQGIIYLYYYHNFEEFIYIDLKEELEKGYAVHDLPLLFSKIKLLSPSQQASVNPSSVIFSWNGETQRNYDLYYSTDPDFTDCVPVTVTAFPLFSYNGTIGFFLVGILHVSTIRRKRKNLFLIFLIIFLGFIMFTGCAHKENDADSRIGEINMTIKNLQSNTIYYWKVVAQPDSNSDFSSESIVRNFTTSD